MRFKGILKSINSGGRSRSIKVELADNVSLDAMEDFKDTVSWFDVDLVTPENDVTEILIDEKTGEVVG